MQKIIRLYPYNDTREPILILISSNIEEHKLVEAVKEFASLDGIYCKDNKQHPEYERAIDVIENGLSAYLKGLGFVLPETVILSL